jgi:hypothetical protein
MVLWQLGCYQCCKQEWPVEFGELLEMEVFQEKLGMCIKIMENQEKYASWLSPEVCLIPSFGVEWVMAGINGCGFSAEISLDGS